MRRPATALVTVALAAAAALVPAAPAPAFTAVRAGPLQARVSEQPWGLELTSRRGRVILSEHGGTGSSPSGTLGFRTALGWSHATGAIDSERIGKRYRATLATTDPLRTIELTLAPAGEGVIALDARLMGPSSGVEAIGIGFEARTGERYLGFGERSNRVDQSGAVVENYVADGPYQSEEYPFLQPITPVWGLRDGREDATYFPVPWLLSSAGYGVLVDNDETSLFRLQSEGDDAWSTEVVPAPAGEAGAELAPPPTRLRMRFFAGPRPAGALRRFTRETGRQPRAAAPWVFGPWYQADDAPTPELAALRDADAPVSVLQTYTHYLPCGVQQGEAERARVAAAHGAGVAITTYFNPMVCTNYDAAYGPAAAADALTETRLGDPYVYRYGADADPDDIFVVSQYDFFEQAGRDAYAGLLREAVADGYDGWMEDFGEYTPLDSVSAESIDGSRAHNAYPRRYHCTAYRAIRSAARPIVRFQRSGWNGAARCAQVVWGGDPTTGWGFDGLRSAVTQALSAGLSGVGIWGSDIGGFFALGFNELTPELLTRWVQLGAVSPVMRTQANGVAVPPRSRPQVIDADQIANWRRYTRLHTQLYPYALAAQEAYRRRGLPLMRHLALAYPQDRRAGLIDDQFLFGPDLLAAPVLEPRATERSLYLPRGGWVDLWRSAGYANASGAIRLGRARVLSGRRMVTLPAPLDELPLLVRAGAVLPLLPPEVDTLAPFGSRAPGVVSLRERRGQIRLLAFPRGRSHSRFGRHGAITSIARGGSWLLRLRSPAPVRYGLQAALPGSIRPCRVELAGEPLEPARWAYNARTRVLRASFSARADALRVASRGC